MGSTHLNVLEVHERPHTEVGDVLAQDGAAKLVGAARQGGCAREIRVVRVTKGGRAAEGGGVGRGVVCGERHMVRPGPPVPLTACCLTCPTDTWQWGPHWNGTVLKDKQAPTAEGLTSSKQMS